MVCQITRGTIKWGRGKGGFTGWSGPQREIAMGGGGSGPGGHQEVKDVFHLSMLICKHVSLGACLLKTTYMHACLTVHLLTCSPSRGGGEGAGRKGGRGGGFSN
jgi:hypothetical protein